MSLAIQMNELLGLRRQAVAVKFQQSAPAGIRRIDETAASGCSYWKLAAEGRNAKQIMLLAEAAHAAGVASDTSMVGRPTCAAIPAVLQSGRTATNLGCIGNRVYTDLADDELYFVIAGSQLASVVEKLETIVNANNQLEVFHRERVSS